LEQFNLSKCNVFITIQKTATVGIKRQYFQLLQQLSCGTKTKLEL